MEEKVAAVQHNEKVAKCELDRLYGILDTLIGNTMWHVEVPGAMQLYTLWEVSPGTITIKDTVGNEKVVQMGNVSPRDAGRLTQISIWIVSSKYCPMKIVQISNP